MEVITEARLAARRRSVSSVKEWLIEQFIRLNGILAIIIVILIFVFLLRDGLPAFKYVSAGKFLAGINWYPLSGIFGSLPLILGSLWVTLGAIAIALPIGLACAIYIAEVAPVPVREILKPTIEVLAGIPSVVIGFIGLVTLAPFIQKMFNLPTGLTALTGSIMLAFMAMPTIISISEDVIVAVPKEYRDGALALGSTKWQAISGVVVPAAKNGIIAAVMLGIGRAIGETMAVLMVTGNAAVIPHSLFQPVRTITATIAAEMGEVVHYSPHYHVLFALGILLFGITFIINLIADIALHKTK
ncbi:MAG: phosphate ABC transporter permease subunit PstC [Armatimonadota bacterium]|nr:phosphate ABC transporter permease subunit PstC [Armatimonadota bacterium]